MLHHTASSAVTIDDSGERSASRIPDEHNASTRNVIIDTEATPPPVRLRNKISSNARNERTARNSRRMRTTRKIRAQRSDSIAGMLASRSIQPHFMNASLDSAARNRITKSMKNTAHTPLSIHPSTRDISGGKSTTSSIPIAASTNNDNTRMTN